MKLSGENNAGLEIECLAEFRADTVDNRTLFTFVSLAGLLLPMWQNGTFPLKLCPIFGKNESDRRAIAMDGFAKTVRDITRKKVSS